MHDIYPVSILGCFWFDELIPNEIWAKVRHKDYCANLNFIEIGDLPYLHIVFKNISIHLSWLYIILLFQPGMVITILFSTDLLSVLNPALPPENQPDGWELGSVSERPGSQTAHQPGRPVRDADLLRLDAHGASQRRTAAAAAAVWPTNTVAPAQHPDRWRWCLRWAGNVELQVKANSSTVVCLCRWAEVQQRCSDQRQTDQARTAVGGTALGDWLPRTETPLNRSGSVPVWSSHGDSERNALISLRHYSMCLRASWTAATGFVLVTLTEEALKTFHLWIGWSQNHETNSNCTNSRWALTDMLFFGFSMTYEPVFFFFLS